MSVIRTVIAKGETNPMLHHGHKCILWTSFIGRFGESPKLRKLFPALLSCEKLSKLFSRRVFLFFLRETAASVVVVIVSGRKRRRNYSLGLRFISFLRKWFSRKKGFFSDEKVHCNYEGDFFSHTVLLQFCSSIVAVATTGYAPQKNDRRGKKGKKSTKSGDTV